MRPRKLLNGLDVLLDALEERVSGFDGNHLGSAMVNQPLGLISWLTPYMVMTALAWNLKAWFALMIRKRERRDQLLRMEFRALP